MPSEEYERVLKILREQVTGEFPPVEQQRQDFEAMARMFRIAEDISTESVRAGDLAAEWVVPPGAVEGRVILYLHGGGYVVGSINTHREMASRIARSARSRALIIDYRLAPEHPYPAAVEDSVAAYGWLLGEGFDPLRIAIAGDSAGGGLAVATAVALRDRGEPMPAALVCLSPWVDLEGIGESMTSKAGTDPLVQREGIQEMARLYLAGKDPRSPLAAPLYADLGGLPPMLIQVGELEVLLDDSVRLAQRAREAGVEVQLDTWEHMFHVWQYFASMMPEGQRAIDEIGKWLQAHLE